MCKTCIHKVVCKHREATEAADKELTERLLKTYNIPAAVNLVCRHEEAEEEF